jgi:hypothetical protein
MNYIWEVFLEDKNREVHLSQSEVISPYYEMPPNQRTQEDHLEYNAMVRYASIFSPLFDIKCSDRRELEKVLFDILSHYLIRVDLKKGYTRREYAIRRRNERILAGSYGDRIRKEYEQLTKEKRYLIGHYLVLSEQTGASMTLFAKAAVELLQSGVVYRDRRNKGSYILYVGKEKNDMDHHIIQLLSDLFLPFGCKLRVMWEHHFGVWGDNNTLLFHKIELL